ncbi:MAG: hypothetical protein H6773_02610 [Pseudomonadales bacterium]|nr:hypothetical protein [Candidatus Woesebacteria bacterium]MCB9801047.1 hypothetical protein [Pseudomonadales bacterium]
MNQKGQAVAGVAIIIALIIIVVAIVLVLTPKVEISIPHLGGASSTNYHYGGSRTVTSLLETIERGEGSEEDIRMLFEGQPLNEIAEMLELPSISASELAMASANSVSWPIPDFPDWNHEDWKHAAESRGSMLKVLLAFELIRHAQQAELYCGSTEYSQFGGLRCIVVAYDPVIGAVAMVFNNAGSVAQPKWGSAVTIIFKTSAGGRVDVRQLRLSSCSSLRVYPLPVVFDPIFEPPLVGEGRCLINK